MTNQVEGNGWGDGEGISFAVVLTLHGFDMALRDWIWRCRVECIAALLTLCELTTS
jgi:hypothetical protein